MLVFLKNHALKFQTILFNIEDETKKDRGLACGTAH